MNGSDDDGVGWAEAPVSPTSPLANAETKKMSDPAHADSQDRAAKVKALRRSVCLFSATLRHQPG